MLIGLHIVLMIVFSFFAGYGIIGFFSLWLKPEKKADMFLVMPVIGYVFSQVLFYQWYYLFENSTLSLYLTITSLCLINLFYILFAHKKSGFSINRLIQTIKRFDKKVFLVLVLIFILSSWQYLLIGEGHYYHSGNEDYFDGVNGGNAYLTNTPTRLIFYDIAGGVHFHAVIKYQYSSQAFWRSLLNVGGLDGFILQEILCLLLTCVGVYWLVGYVFKGGEKIALWTSFWSAAAAFYFSTYMTGHIGSIMYVSVIPVFIGLMLLWIRKEIGWVWLLILALLYYFIDNTYPGPIYFVLIPLILLAVHERILIPLLFWKRFFNFFGFQSNIKFKEQIKDIKYLRLLGLIALLLAGILIFIWWLWNYTEQWRFAAILRTSISWKITLFKEMFMVFWGIYPPGSTGTASILPIFISNDYINTFSFILAILVSLLAVVAVVRCYQFKERYFLLLYGILFIFYLVVMRYFWGSSYYLYKFLYVHMFLIIIALILWIFEAPRNWRKWKRKIFYTGFILLGIINLLWNISLGMDFLVRPYHKKEKIANFFKNVSTVQLSKSYLDIPNEVDNLEFRYIFSERNINLRPTKENAQYIIRLKNVGNAVYNSVDEAHTVFDNGLLSVHEKLNDNNITLRTLYEPNNSNGLNINWIGDWLSNLNTILKNYIAELTNYIRINKLQDKAYLDISEPGTYYLVNRALKENGLKINSDPEKSIWFIRINFKTSVLEFIRQQEKSIYNPVIGEFSKWQNTFFSIDYIPLSNRAMNPLYLGSLNFTPLINYIKEHGNSVYLDIPHYEQLYLFLKESLPKLKIKICDNPEETELFFRFILDFPYDQFNYRTVINSNEKLIGRAYPIMNLAEIYWDVELVNIPQEGRSYINALPSTTVPFRILTSINENNFSIIINNVTQKAKYLRILLAPGPSIDFSDFILEVSDEKEILKKFHIFSPQTLIDLPLDDFTKKNGKIYLTFTGENLVGKSLLPVEDRFLNYMLLGAELTENINGYSPVMRKILNHKTLSDGLNYLSKYISVPEPDDIIDVKDTSLCSLGLGWYNLEASDDKPMRWVGDKPAEIVLDNVDKKHSSILLNLEPGPGCGGKPLTLKIYNKDLLLKEKVVTDRNNVEIQLPEEIYKSNKEQIILKLVAETENAKIASDPRVLNYRVFNISFKGTESQQKTIIDKAFLDKISLGNGWYPFETYEGKSFQWVGKEPAEIIYKYSDNNLGSIKLNLEPGPSCGKEPLKLYVYLNDKLINENRLISRKIIEIDLKNYKNNLKDGNNIIKLVPSSKNISVPGDPRTLNFRVFNINYIQQ